MLFRTATTERMRITSTGNVGIGTSSPTEKLDVAGNIAITGTGNLSLQRPLIPSARDQGTPQIAFKYYSTGTTYTTGAQISALTEAAWSSTSAPTNMVFLTVPSGSTTLAERMRIDSGGNVGIGTSGQPSKLTVLANSTDTNFADQSFPADSSGVSLYNLGATNSNFTALSFIASNAGGGNTSASILAQSKSSGFAADLVFTQRTASTASTERMRLDSSGNLGIGTSSPATKLDVSGAITSSGSINPYLALNNGTAISYVQVSSNNLDIRVGGANAITLNTNSTERMRIDSSGNVGIGTSSPTAKLHVVGSSGVIVDSNSSSDAGINTKTTAGNWKFGTGIGSSTNCWNVYDLTAGAERMRLDSSGNLGLGVTPQTWSSGFKAIQIGTGSSIYNNNAGDTFIGANYYTDASGVNRYIATTLAAAYGQLDGTHSFFTAPSGTAGNAITFTQAMTLDASGNLLVGTTTQVGKLNLLTSADNGNNSEYSQTNFAIGNAAYPCSIRAYRYGGSYLNGLDFYYNSTGQQLGMRIDSSGNLLVGTTDSVLVGRLKVASTIRVSDAASETNALLTTVSGSSATIETRYATPLILGTGATERFRIDSTGNALFAKAVRATITTDNDLSFDMNAASNFKSTPTSGGALTFTNITSGQTGNIILVNGSNYAITAAATTKVSATCLATISATGTYWLSYYSDGTNVYVANTGALA
jgi:hypothetical protein